MGARALILLSFFSVPSKCQSKSQETERFLIFVVCCFFPPHVTLSLTIFASGQLVVGGYSGSHLFSVEIFPPPNDTCSVPSLPGPRSHHSLSLLSGGRLAVCGGEPTNEAKSCIVWTHGSTNWTHLHTTRSSYYIFHTN